MLRCGIAGCPSSFKRYSSMLSHLSRKHNNQDPLQPINPSTVYQELDMSCDSSISTDVNGDQENIQPDFPEQMVDSTPGSNQVAGLGPCNKAAGLFLLTLKEKHRLTQAAVDFTLSQVKQLTKYVVEDVQSSVLGELQGCANIPDLSSCFAEVNPFEGLETEHFQSKFYREHFSLIVSIKITFIAVKIYCLNTGTNCD